MPALGADAFLEKLAKGQAVPAILLLGRETYLRDICRARIIEAMVPEGAREWGVSRFDAGGDAFDVLNRPEDLEHALVTAPPGRPSDARSAKTVSFPWRGLLTRIAWGGRTHCPRAMIAGW